MAHSTKVAEHQRQRAENLQKLAEQEFDVAIIGGGINGAVAAASLAARGARVALIERDDFASGVSSQSSNLAWGGIKYMESLEFPLVWKLCRSRNQLNRAFPSSVSEIRFLTVVRKNFRLPAFVVFLGAVLYWLIGACHTQRPRYLSKRQIRALEPALDLTEVAAGFEYSDCYLENNDARFVFRMVRTAVRHGATTANYLSASSLEFIPSSNLWRITATDELHESRPQITVRAKSLINAAGPWADALNALGKQQTRHRHLLSKGVHLIVDRVTENRRVLTLFASDGRPFFIIPMGNRTCIGTTDTPTPDPEAPITDADRAFILDNVNAGLELKRPLTTGDIIAERCGVRPLAVENDDDEGDWMALSRKHHIEANADNRYVSIFGGKLTDCLNVGDEIAAAVAGLGITLTEPEQAWCGEPDTESRNEFLHAASALQLDQGRQTLGPFGETMAETLWRRYGADSFIVLERLQQSAEAREAIISEPRYLRAELEFARDHEMVAKLDDFLRRRSMLAQQHTTEYLHDSQEIAEAQRILFP